MDHNSDDDDDFGVVTTLSVRLWGLLIALVIGTAFVVAVVRPYLNDLDTQGTRRTHDYITSLTRPMVERDGELVPQDGAQSTVRMNPARGGQVEFR